MDRLRDGIADCLNGLVNIRRCHIHLAKFRLQQLTDQAILFIRIQLIQKASDLPGLSVFQQRLDHESLSQYLCTRLYCD